MFTFIREQVDNIGAAHGQQVPPPPHRHIEPADRIAQPKSFTSCRSHAIYHSDVSALL